MVKNPFGIFSLLFSASGEYYKSLTHVNNLQHLLRLLTFNKARLVAFHKKVIQRNYTNWFLPNRENQSALDSLHAITKTIITKRLLQTDDAKLQCLTPLSESTSLSKHAIFSY